ncbi:MAG TPA: hypothetical protein VFX22_07635, partial [Candidatus Kapabacteria bacterium]|nr:hypothetical protein [Candidatus Kapabacteria bacterium]
IGWSDTSQWIYISSDLGNSWYEAAPAPPNGSQGYTLIVSNEMFIGFVGSNGIWTKPLSGGSWTQASYPAGNTIKSQAVLDSTIFIADSKLNYSTNFGKTWNLPANKGLDSINEEFYSFAVHGGTIIANVWYGIVRSTDSGRSWTRVDGAGGYPSSGPYPGGGYTVPVTYADGNFIVGEPGGIYRSSDGVTWQFASQGMTDPSVQSIATLNDTFFAIVNGAVYHSTDNGETWSEQADFEHAYQFVHVKGMLFALTDNGLLWRWQNGKWKFFRSPVNLALAMIDSTLYGCRWNELLSSSDTGATWKQVFSQSTIDWLQYIYAFGDTLFALPNVGAAGWPVYFSTDHGSSWEQSGEFPTDGGFFYMLGAQDSNDELIYNYGRLNLSTDRGFNWQTIDTHFATFEESWNNQIYVGLSDTPASSSGLFRLSGTSLLQILPDTAVGQINDFAADSKYAYIGTEEKSIWRTSIANFSSGVEPITTLTNQELTIYPNPSLSTSTVSFLLAERGYISLKLFDDLGVERDAIFEGELDAGQHIIPFADLRLPNGIYEVVLLTSTARSVGRLVIER